MEVEYHDVGVRPAHGGDRVTFRLDCADRLDLGDLVEELEQTIGDSLGILHDEQPKTFVVMTLAQHDDSDLLSIRFTMHALRSADNRMSPTWTRESCPCTCLRRRGAL
jgi:hypothetical protein